MNKKIIRAEQKYVRISPRKVALVAKAIKKLSPTEALEHLKFLNKRSAKVLYKVIKQALGNAEENEKINEDDLEFEEINVLKGATYKRWRPVSRGRAHSIFKRTSHVVVKLRVREEGEKEIGKGRKKEKKEKTVKTRAVKKSKRKGVKSGTKS